MSTVNNPARSRQSMGRIVIFSILLGFGLVAAAAGIVLGANNANTTGKILDGVSMAGVNLGGLTLKQAESVIGRQVKFPLTGVITIQYGDKSWNASPAELGLYLDIASSAESALSQGREGGFLTKLLEQLSISKYGRQLAPTFVYDESKSLQFLQNIASQVDQPAIEAGVSLNGTEVVVRNGQTGISVDVQASMAALSIQMRAMQSGSLQLVVTTIQPRVLDASSAADMARQILSQPLMLIIPAGWSDQGSTTIIAPDALAAMLAFDQAQDGNGTRITVRVDEIALQTYLTELAPKLHLDAVNSRFRFNDDTRQLDLVQPAVIGRSLNLAGTVSAIQNALAANQHSVELMFDVNKPAVTDDMTGAQLGITELIHAETSYFRGSSSERLQNITIAAGKFDGLLIAPGETFSMAQALGDVSLDNGYAEALIILGDQTIKGVGGGVCQVSTTLFRTAFFAGFPIVERHAHAYRVKYYEQTVSGHDSNLAGMDATVFVPLVDLKFVNDTQYWLLMETYVYPGSQKLVWKFYSTKDGRTVQWETTGPTNLVDPPEDVYKENPELATDEYKQTDWAVQGADVTVNRTVFRNGAVYFQDVFNTHYEAWPNMYEYGPGSQVPMPDASIPTD